MNTEVFRRAVGSEKAKKYGMGAYRVGMTTAVAWLCTHFATIKDLDNTREWVRSISHSRTVQFESMDKRMDLTEQRTAYIEGRLGFPLHTHSITVKTNTP